MSIMTVCCIAITLEDWLGVLRPMLSAPTEKGKTNETDGETFAIFEEAIAHEIEWLQQPAGEDSHA